MRVAPSVHLPHRAGHPRYATGESKSLRLQVSMRIFHLSVQPAIVEVNLQFLDKILRYQNRTRPTRLALSIGSLHWDCYIWKFALSYRSQITAEFRNRMPPTKY